MRYDQYIHHRQSLRLREYDYSQPGYYFVTVCVYEHVELFGKINNNEMILNEYGKIAEKIWLEIPQHFENIQLDEYVIMPNHVHGIIIIGDNDNHDVGHRHACALQHTKRQYQKLPTVVGSYKSAVTKFINMHGDKIYFGWQKSFYDHVIRDEIALRKIREYIINNPAMWDSDEENPANL